MTSIKDSEQTVLRGLPSLGSKNIETSVIAYIGIKALRFTILHYDKSAILHYALVSAKCISILRIISHMLGLELTICQ